MINLIPNAEKKEIIKGFYWRLVVLFFVMMGVSFIIAFVAILPPYFLSSVKNRIADTNLEALKNEPALEPNSKTLKTVEDLKTKLTLIEKTQNNKFSVLEKVINIVLIKKMDNIKINSISYYDDSLKGKKIKIQGSASSREVLLSFRQKLEDDITFKNVDLPISNFIKGSNIQFNLNLTL